MPSSWTTPPESEGASPSNSPKSDKEFPLHQDIYIPQMFICSNNNLCNHAVRNPYSAPSTLVDEDTCSHTSADSFPCPTPEPITIAHSSTSPSSIPILWCPASEHPLGPLYSDAGLQDLRSPLPIPCSTTLHQEAQEVQVNREEAPGDPSTDEQANEWHDANQGPYLGRLWTQHVTKRLCLEQGY